MVKYKDKKSKNPKTADAQKLDALRHSAAHVMAHAVMDLFPNVKLGIGPTITDGFYYDFDLAEAITQEDFTRIENKMHQIIAEDYAFEREVLSRKEASKLFSEKNQPYKLELLDRIPEGEQITIYKSGGFVDLCKGPHVASTGKIPTVKLIKVAGAYFAGDEKNKMLQRVYGTAFFSKQHLNDHLKNLEEAQKRDHRKLGKSLNYFEFSEKIGPGNVIYLPEGAILRRFVEDYILAEHIKRDYLLLRTPHLFNATLWYVSGHMNHYRENMYVFKDTEGQERVIKPMNCVGHILCYKTATRSYRELPIRYFELGTVFRKERSGVLHGLMRVREFTQDDAHIFCTPDQAQAEIKKVLEFTCQTLSVFGFKEFSFSLSTRPEDYIGTEQIWEEATRDLEQALKEAGLEYKVEPFEGAFYGPKIDIKLTDALGRRWQCGTVQCDFALPERFELRYVDSKGKECVPVMIHRVILGSLERFIGVLTEHYGGAFPLWLAPVQVSILPVTEHNLTYANEVSEILRQHNIRTEIPKPDNTLSYRIRQAQVCKRPYILVVGDKEQETKTINVRGLIEKQMGEMEIVEFATKVAESSAKKLDCVEKLK